MRICFLVDNSTFGNQMVFNKSNKICICLDVVFINRIKSTFQLQARRPFHILASSPEWWGPCCSTFCFFMLSYYVLRSEFRIVMSVAIFAKNDDQLVFISSCLQEDACLVYVCLCVFAYSGVQHIL